MVLAAPLALALAAAPWGAVASPATAAPVGSASVRPASFTDDRIHIYGASPDGGNTVRVVIEAGSGLRPFGDEETMLIETGEDQVSVTMLDGSPRLAVHNTNPGNIFVLCLPSVGTSTNSTQVTCSLLATSGRTLVDFSDASVATTTVVKSSAPEYRNTPYEAIDFIGGAGPDYFEGGTQADSIDGGAGDDDLFGGPGNDDILGSVGADTVYGNAGRDTVNGGADNDYVVGDGDLDGAEPAPDIILGGAGVDSLDSEDKLADTRVDCENAPGAGAIDFDRGLDLPFNCPVTLAPTAPSITRVANGGGAVTVDWAPPFFDGNSAVTDYEVHAKDQKTGAVTQGRAEGTESSFTFAGLKKDATYEMTVRATNKVGTSPWSEAVRIKVTEGPGAPGNVRSAFATFSNATVSWSPPATAVDRYEVAMRVKNPRGTRWLAWETLPNGMTTGTSLAVGDVLRIANRRDYQLRVRSLDGTAKSAWATSPVRYAAPVQTTITKSTFLGLIETTFQVTPPQSFEANFDKVTGVTLSFTNQAGSYPAVSISQTGATYVATFSASPPENSSCNLAITYTVKDSSAQNTMTASAPCQSPRP